MVAIAPAPLIEAPEPLRARYGLFTAASGPLDLPAHGEAAGVRYVPSTCGSAHAYGVQCYSNGEGGTPAPDKPHDGDNDEVNTGVFLALATLECSSVGYTLSELQAKVQRRLDTSEQGTVEAAFWTGLDFEGNSLGILSLDGTAQNIGGGYNPDLITDVVGALERYAYTTNGYGYQAYIHAPVEVAAFGHESGLVLRDGNRLVTPMGSVWSFGAYPGGSIIITGQTTVWRGPVQSYDAFEPITNERFLVAERAYSVSYDCFAGRAEFDPLELTSP